MGQTKSGSGLDLNVVIRRYGNGLKHVQVSRDRGYDRIEGSWIIGMDLAYEREPPWSNPRLNFSSHCYIWISMIG